MIFHVILSYHIEYCVSWKFELIVYFNFFLYSHCDIEKISISNWFLILQKKKIDFIFLK